MKLDEYLKQGVMTAAALAAAIGAKSTMQVRQWQHGYAKRKPGPAYCIAIERATGGAVTRKDLRPDDYGDIWPELVDTKGASAAPEKGAVDA